MTAKQGALTEVVVNTAYNISAEDQRLLKKAWFVPVGTESCQSRTYYRGTGKTTITYA